MSQILVGYIRIKESMSKEQCAIKMLQAAHKMDIGLWFNEQVHSDAVIDDFRDKKDYLIFSFSDTLQYETIHRLLLPDLCRDEPNMCSLDEDIEKIITVLNAADSFSDLVHLFLGVYQCFPYEYGTCRDISIAKLKKELAIVINNSLFPFRWYSISSEAK